MIPAVVKALPLFDPAMPLRALTRMKTRTVMLPFLKIVRIEVDAWVSRRMYKLWNCEWDTFSLRLWQESSPWHARKVMGYAVCTGMHRRKESFLSQTIQNCFLKTNTFGAKRTEE